MKSPFEVPITFFYRNWRGHSAIRSVLPRSVYFGSNKWHPTPQWFLRAIDLNRCEERDFALADIDFKPPPSKDGVDYVAEAIKEHWGERCGTPDDECPTCQAWGAYDAMVPTPQSGNG